MSVNASRSVAPLVRDAGRIPPVVAVLALIAGFSVPYLFDLRHGRTLDLPRWFVPLRGVLSTLVVICLGVVGLSSL